MSLGDSYWETEFGANPDFMFPANRGRRQRQFSDAMYDQQMSYLASDRDYATEMENYEAPRRQLKFEDSMGARGLGLSGLTQQGTDELQRRHILKLGDIDRNYARGTQAAQFGKQGAGLDYMDTLDDATMSALNKIVSGEYDFFR